MGRAPDYTAELARQRNAADDEAVAQLLAMITPLL
jgi:hypothetical protein